MPMPILHTKFSSHTISETDKIKTSFSSVLTSFMLNYVLFQTIATVVNTTVTYNRTCSRQTCTFDYASYYCIDASVSVSHCSKCCSSTRCNSDVYAPESLATRLSYSACIAMLMLVLSMILLT